MSYKMYINKKRKPVEGASPTEQISDILQACKKAEKMYHKATEKEQKAKYLTIVKKKEAMAKVKGYEACRDEKDIPIMHKMIREIEWIRVALSKNPI